MSLLKNTNRWQQSNQININRLNPNRFSRVFRIIFPVLTTVILFAFMFFIIVLPTIKENLIGSKQEMIQELTMTVWKLLESFEHQVQSGKYSQEEAQMRATTHIRSLRYGIDNKDYFWINDIHNRMVLHPYRQDLEGKDVANIQDPKGKYLTAEFVKTATEKGAGFVEYQWQLKDNPGQIIPKFSYVRLYKPWGWIIGTGVYYQDIDEKVLDITQTVNISFAFILSFIIMLSAYIILQTGKNEKERLDILYSLGKSEEKYRYVIDNAHEAIVVVQNEKIVFFNPKLNQMFSETGTEINSSTLSQLIHQEDRSSAENQLMHQNQEKQNPSINEFRSIDTNNQFKWLEIKSVTILWNDTPATLNLISDITKRKQFENELHTANENLEKRVEERTQKLKQANNDLQIEIAKKALMEKELIFAKQQAESANESKTEFLANMSHELRTPMHGVLSYSRLGQKKIDSISKEKIFYYFNQIETAGNRLMPLLDDLLNLSKLESGKMDFEMKENDIQTIVLEAVKEFKPILKEKKTQIQVHPSTASSKIKCDAFKIGQVLRNIISNAISYSPENTKIEIKIINENILIDRPNNQLFEVQSLTISVKDEGVGIPAHELNSVFNKFIQSSKTKTGAGGTGLGLAICRSIIKGHDGRIWVKNNKEKGVSFYFSLPYHN